MKKPSFKVVTHVVMVLTALGVVTKGARKYVPPLPPNRLASSDQEFLRQAGHQQIQWMPNTSAAFSLARHEGKPILFLVGAPWSTVARHMDEKAFTDPDVIRYLATNFVCVRVDASEDRRWLSTYLPYSRMPLSLLPGFQAYILDSQGRMIDLIGRTSAVGEFGTGEFLRALIKAMDLLDTIERGAEPPLLPGQAQHADLNYLEDSPREPMPPFRRYASFLASFANNPAGGFPINGLQPILPDAFRYLIMAGRADSVRQVINPVLYSPMYDFLDGGFFRFCLNDGGRTVTFDKLSTQNASMAWSLALAYEEIGTPAYRLLARSTVDCVTDNLYSSGYIATCRIGLDRPNARSRRHSFSLTALRRILDAREARWVQKALSLRPESNPQMVPYFINSVDLQHSWPRAEQVRKRLLKATKVIDPLATTDSAEAHCYSAARLVQVARLWNDDGLANKTEMLVVAAGRFRKSKGISARITDHTPSDYLGDWLAYSDLSLQDFLLNGRVMSLQKGVAALRQAAERFKGIAPGEYYAGLPIDSALAPQDANAPEVADTIQESCTARMIRLCRAYGDLLDDRELRQRAYKTVDLYSTALADAGPMAAGYFCAALETKDDVSAVTVGPDAVTSANELFRLVPTRLVAPAVGPVRLDLQRRPKGVYLVTRAGISGPFSVDQAAARLRVRAPLPPDAP